MKEKTVLILGAGSACDYGYPTGNELTDLISRHYSYSGLKKLLVEYLQPSKVAEYLSGLDYIEEHFFKSRSLSIDTWLAKEENALCEKVGTDVFSKRIE